MSIFDSSIKRYGHVRKPNQPSVPNGTKVPLVVYCYTKPMGKCRDIVQLFYHGGGVYTAITYLVQKDKPFSVRSGVLTDLIVKAYPELGKRKKLNVTENPFNKKPMLNNVSIQSIATFVSDNDKELLEQLVPGGDVVASYEGQKVQLIDVRSNNEEHEFGFWYNPLASVVEFRFDTEGDFVQTLANQLRVGSNERMIRTRDQIVNQVLTKHLRNTQIQFYNDVIDPCVSSF